MSLAPAPAAPVWLCARCGGKPFTGGSGGIAAHLIEEHGLSAMTALAEARGPAEAPPSPSPSADVAPAPHTTTKEAPMPTGVYPRKGDPTKPCGSCKQPKDAHRPGCPRDKSATGGGARAKRPKPATARRPGRPRKIAGPAVVPTNGADPIATIRGALEQLEAELAGARVLKAALAKAFPAER